MSMTWRNQNVTPMLCSPNPNDNWPIILVVEASDIKNAPLTYRMDDLHCTCLFKGMCGPYKQTKMMNDDRQLLVHFKNSLQWQPSLQI